MKIASMHGQLTFDEMKGLLERLPKDFRWMNMGNTIPCIGCERIYSLWESNATLKVSNRAGRVAVREDDSGASEYDYDLSGNRDNRHSFRYDADGNMTYVSTAREIVAKKRVSVSRERKLLWDEEDRLRAISDNGFVSCYWNDADGVRTVKTSGMNESVFVDGVHRASNTVTSEYTLYVSPMFVRSENDQYTKHFYAGTQRIASKIGNRREWDKFNPDTARMAGTGITGFFCYCLNFGNRFDLLPKL